MIRAIVNARLIDPASGLDAPGGVVIKDGRIVAMGPQVSEAPSGAGECIDAGGCCLAPGLIDLRAKTGEPGEEHRETLETASRAAVAGGITRMVVMPDTQPVIDDVALVQFVLNRGRETALNRVHVAGALTVALAGAAMAEIGLMHEAGAVFMTNGDLPVSDAGVMKRAMAYAAGRGIPVASRPDERTLSGSGVMNAGVRAARMGLAGLPPEAEWIGAARDLMLAERTGCRLILDQVSTARTLELVDGARSRGADVACTLAAHTLTFNELDVGDYLTYCKVNPPFRAEDERQAMITAVREGRIDAIVSAHDPQPPEAKRLPYGEAKFGAAGLETVLPALLSLVADGALDLISALKPVTCGPADLLGMPGGRLAIGVPADLVLFDPDKPWLCDRASLRSRSTNSPYDGRRLTGRAVTTWVAGEPVHGG